MELTKSTILNQLSELESEIESTSAWRATRMIELQLKRSSLLQRLKYITSK